MKKRPQGSSLYFATDKNIFDALTNRKVDVATVRAMFEERNILVSAKTPRDDLAKYFSRLSHDFFDHQRIAARLGIVARRERITSMEVAGIEDKDALQAALNSLKSDREGLGDVVQVSREGERITLNIQYDTVDYGKTEFSQVQTRDGVIEIEKSASGYTIRSTQNDYISEVRDTILASVEKTSSAPLKKMVVSMFDISDHKLRSGFFDRLTNDLEGFKRIDVLAVYVYKPKPNTSDDAGDSSGDVDTHVEKISMRGNGVSRSEMLQVLTNDEYYINKIVWTISELMSAGTVVYEIEAGFEDPKDCTGFSFILSGVYPVEDGAVSSRKRTPLRGEIDEISRLVDVHSRAVVAELRQKANAALTEAE